MPVNTISNNGSCGPNLFLKDPRADTPELRQKYQQPERGLHLYFRNMKLKMQTRFTELLEHENIPRVFVHGSPHIDNYSRSERGVAMVDFDRSRIGPYAWDLVRVLTSTRCHRYQHAPLQQSGTPASLLAGFKKGFRFPRQAFKQMDLLANKKPLNNRFPTRHYLQKNKRWARRLRLDPLPASNPEMLALLHSYLHSRQEIDLLNEYSIDSAGRARGTMGRQRILIVLRPAKTGRDLIFLEIKRVREDPDNRWYFNPYPHHGKRMIKAAELYAPGWEVRQGYASHRGLQYWGHQVPNQNIKIKRPLDGCEQKDFLFSVGSQLGRAHRLSLQDSGPEDLLHLAGNFDRIVDAAEIMAREIHAAHRVYLDVLAQQQGTSFPDR